MSVQDYRDPLEPFDYIVQKLDDNKASLGLRYIAQLDEELLPMYPAVLVQIDATERRQHATRMFHLQFNIDLWVFHNELTVDKATRSRKDIQLATDIRKLLHADRTLGGHIIFGFVSGEFSGVSARLIENAVTTIVTTRLTWQGENRALFEDS
jgi:hypothetical protein